VHLTGRRRSRTAASAPSREATVQAGSEGSIQGGDGVAERRHREVGVHGEGIVGVRSVSSFVSVEQCLQLFYFIWMGYIDGICGRKDET
jgi:hypothetical protein